MILMKVLLILMILFSGEVDSQSTMSSFIAEGNSMAPLLKSEEKFVVIKATIQSIRSSVEMLSYLTLIIT